MSPRPYQLGQRKAASEQTRARILAAARALLMAPDGYSRFSIETVARQADVARMTVYHQFGSKAGLLEGLCDSLAASGGMEQLASAFQQPEPLAAFNRYIEVFGHFWEVDRLVMRRLRALAALDPDFEQVIRMRDEWRRKGVRALLQNKIEKQLLSIDETGKTFDEVVDVLFTLTSFETFDALAGPSHTLEEVAPVVQRLVQAAIGLAS
jgi:AcrR family transcriptional regulator